MTPAEFTALLVATNAVAAVAVLVALGTGVAALVRDARDQRTEQLMRSVAYRVPMTRAICRHCRTTNAARAAWCWRCHVPFLNQPSPGVGATP